mgnify:CR=1 FL=1|tara:strand:- start:163464 stop:164213 length:750 start_codon:yes stop_codon:yes gene_type:complete
MWRLTAIVVAFVVVLAGMVFVAPARLVGILLPPGQVVMQGFSGTVWQGEAARALVKTDAGYLHLGSISWSLKPWSLLLLAPRAEFNSQWGTQTLSGDVALHGQRDIDIHQLQASLPADLLRQLAPLTVAGTLALQVEGVRVRDGLPREGSGRLVWQNARWQSPQAMLTLGSYVLEFEQAEGGALSGDVLTLSGPVKATGKLQLQHSDYAIDVLISGDPLDEQIQQALSLLAAPGPQGYRVKFNGALKGL